MANYTHSIQNLMNELASLPGVGTRSAERIAFHLLKQRPEDALRLADAIREFDARAAAQSESEQRRIAEAELWASEEMRRLIVDVSTPRDLAARPK